MVVRQAVPAKGFDVNQQLTAAEAAAFKANGMDFCIRYLPRTPQLIAGNLTAGEISDILGSGLALSAVQHCPEPNWSPTGILGDQYGKYAERYANAIGLPPGMNIWLDLESVNPSSTPADIIDYCDEWFCAVQEGGYIPALYVGWGTGLTAQQLYEKLSFQHYWRAYNYDDGVATRGYQIIQSTQKTLNGIAYDPNNMQSDELGGLPMLLYPS